MRVMWRGNRNSHRSIGGVQAGIRRRLPCLLYAKRDSRRDREGWRNYGLGEGGVAIESGVQEVRAATVDRIRYLSYPRATKHGMSVAFAHSKPIAVRKVKGSRLACHCSLKPAT